MIIIYHFHRAANTLYFKQFDFKTTNIYNVEYMLSESLMMCFCSHCRRYFLMLALNPALHPPNTPRIGYDHSSIDAEDIINLNNHLAELSQNCKDFACCVALFHNSSEQYFKEHKLFNSSDFDYKNRPISLHESWSRLAARNGALELRNYRKTLETIQSTSGKIDDIRNTIDLKILRNARKRFDKYFPDVDTLRHSVAHPEAYNDPIQSKKMGTK